MASDWDTCCVYMAYIVEGLSEMGTLLFVFRSAALKVVFVDIKLIVRNTK